MNLFNGKFSSKKVIFIDIFIIFYLQLYGVREKTAAATSWNTRSVKQQWIFNMHHPTKCLTLDGTSNRSMGPP